MIFFVHADKPVFDSSNEESIIGIENEPLIISLKADGNPQNIAYTWTKDGLPIMQVGSSSGMDRIISDGSVLNITKLSRHDAGTYFCEALNSQGSSLAQINITVQCKSPELLLYELFFSNCSEFSFAVCITITIKRTFGASRSFSRLFQGQYSIQTAHSYLY